MAEFFPVDILGRYEKTASVTDMGASLSTIVDLIFSLAKDLDKSNTNGETEKVKSPYDTVAEQDLSAKADVTEWVMNMTDMLAAFCDANPNRAYWLGTEWKVTSQFVTGEVTFARNKSERGLPMAKRSDTGTQKRADAKELIAFARKLWGIVPDLATEQSEGKLSDNVKVKDGLLALPRIVERKDNDSGIPTQGRYAPVYSATFTVNGETYPPGTNPMVIIRGIWQGSDRVRKRVSDLWDPFTDAGYTKIREGESITLSFDTNDGPCEVTVLKTVKDSDES